MLKVAVSRLHVFWAIVLAAAVKLLLVFLYAAGKAVVARILARHVVQRDRVFADRDRVSVRPPAVAVDAGRQPLARLRHRRILPDGGVSLEDVAPPIACVPVA